MIDTGYSLAVIHDERSKFSTLSMGWWSRRETTNQAFQELQVAASAVAAQLSPVWQGWSKDVESIRFTVLIEPSLVGQWVRAFGSQISSATRKALGKPAIALVSPQNVDDSLEMTLLETLDGCRIVDSVPVISNLKQTAYQGFEQILVQGTDPARVSSPAATFMAMCLLVGTPLSLLPATLNDSKTGAVLQLGRELVNGSPSISWNIVAPQQKSLAASMSLVEAVQGFRAEQNRTVVSQARDFAIANMSRAWRAPSELANSIVQYEIMGWSGELVRSPREMLLEVDDSVLETALTEFIRPLVEVLGKSNS